MAVTGCQSSVSDSIVCRCVAITCKVPCCRLCSWGGISHCDQQQFSASCMHCMQALASWAPVVWSCCCEESSYAIVFWTYRSTLRLFCITAGSSMCGYVIVGIHVIAVVLGAQSVGNRICKLLCLLLSCCTDCVDVCSCNLEQPCWALLPGWCLGDDT